MKNANLLIDYRVATRTYLRHEFLEYLAFAGLIACG